MVEESCLIILKPDAILKSLTGNVITALSEAKLRIIGTKVVSVKKELAEKNYEELGKKKPQIFESTLKYIMGEYHTPRVIAMIYRGEGAIKKVREIVGETNPEKAHPTSIRGRYGRVHSQTGIFENLIHASDSKENAEKEIKLWFNPDEIVEEIYPTKEEEREISVKVWK